MAHFWNKVQSIEIFYGEDEDMKALVWDKDGCTIEDRTAGDLLPEALSLSATLQNEDVIYTWTEESEAVLLSSLLGLVEIPETFAGVTMIIRMNADVPESQG